MLSSTTLPRLARLAIRNGEHFQLPTAGICQGHFQANLTILPSRYADDFQKFCKANAGPFPLIFHSKPGQFDAPSLSNSDSDVRTDVPAYWVWKNGERYEVVGDLLKYSNVFDDYCSFYLGCSFSFDQPLLNAGVPLRNVEENTKVSMYKTNVPCHPVGPFKCNLVVSLRPIPKHLVETAFRVTSPLNRAHGAPIHIGDPAAIGIKDITKVDFGDAMPFKDGDVAVFWACGVTGVEAIKASKPELAFTHSPGSMYLADISLDEDVDTDTISCVIEISDNPYSASVVSESVKKKILLMEELIKADPGNRGIAGLVVEGDLLKSALALSHSNSVAIVTGFPCVVGAPSLYENDGPPGAFALAEMLQSLGKDVCFLADEGTFDVVMESLITSLLHKGILTKHIPVVSCPANIDKSSASQFLNNGDDSTTQFDHLVAIERVGVAKDGNFYTMTGRDVSKHVSNIDLVFEAAKSLPGVKTTGIGDGGNEIGMGKVLEKVHEDVPLGEKIACVTATDYLISTGVSNWGGYALSAALASLYSCPIHDRYARRSCGFPRPRCDIVKHLPNVDNQRKMLEVLVDMGIYAGNGSKSPLSVDNLPFDGAHSKMIEDMLELC